MPRRTKLNGDLPTTQFGVAPSHAARLLSPQLRPQLTTRVSFLRGSTCDHGQASRLLRRRRRQRSRGQVRSYSLSVRASRCLSHSPHHPTGSSSSCTMTLLPRRQKSTFITSQHVRYRALTRRSFRALCTGEKGLSSLSDRPLYYKNSIIHRSIKDFMIQGGGASPLCCATFLTALTSQQTLRNAMALVASQYTAACFPTKISRVRWTLEGNHLP